MVNSIRHQMSLTWEYDPADPPPLARLSPAPGSSSSSESRVSRKRILAFLIRPEAVFSLYSPLGFQFGPVHRENEGRKELSSQEAKRREGANILRTLKKMGINIERESTIFSSHERRVNLPPAVNCRFDDPLDGTCRGRPQTMSNEHP